MKVNYRIHSGAWMALLFCLMSPWFGCSGPSSKPDRPVTKTQGTAPAPEASSAEADSSLTIQRATLKEYLKRGAGDFNAKVGTRPAFHGGRFFGWRIISYKGPGPIQVGDIVTAIDGLPIERPEQVMKVWNGLSQRDLLEVKLIRNHKPLVFKWRYVD